MVLNTCSRVLPFPPNRQSSALIPLPLTTGKDDNSGSQPGKYLKRPPTSLSLLNQPYWNENFCSQISDCHQPYPPLQSAPLSKHQNVSNIYHNHSYIAYSRCTNKDTNQRWPIVSRCEWLRELSKLFVHFSIQRLSKRSSDFKHDLVLMSDAQIEP